MAGKVYFARVSDGESPEVLAEKTARLYKEAGFASQLEPDALVGIKQHLGERGGDGFLRPPIAARVAELIKEAKAKPFLSETCTLYKGSRSNAVNYINLAYEHGFTPDVVGCPVIISDGLVGSSQVMVRVDGKHYKEVPIASDAYHAFAFVVLSHVTGHCGAGFGAAIKNVGMGLASRAGKLDQHHGDVPIPKEDNCTACGVCVEMCPAGAIMLDKGIVINSDECIGCGECLSVCRFDAIGFSWNETSPKLHEKMAEHVLAVTKTHPGRMSYFNYMTHVTAECDCFGIKQDACVADVGIVASDDIVAVDQATIDLLKSETGRDLFEEAHPEIDYSYQVTYAESLGLGSRKYELIEVK